MFPYGPPMDHSRTLKISIELAGLLTFLKGMACLLGTLKVGMVFLADVFCFNGQFDISNGIIPPSAHVEAPGYITGKLAKTGEDIRMMGRMVLEIDVDTTYVYPFEMKGYWVSEKGNGGTHYGVFFIEGTSKVEEGLGGVGRGTLSGWIRENQ